MYENYDDESLLALCVWREARGEIFDAKFAVACSIRNRVNHPRWWGRDYRSVILDPWQYSSFNSGDPNATKFPGQTDAAYTECLEAAQNVLKGIADTTEGAVSYYDKSLDHNPPKWSLSPQFAYTVDLGALHFYTLTEFGHVFGPESIPTGTPSQTIFLDLGH